MDILNKVRDETDANRAVALCAIVTTRGSTPQPAGTMLCVDQAAQITGTLGGGCVEAEVRRRAHEMLAARRSELITFNLDHDFGFDDGMICGGQMDVAVSVISPSDHADVLAAARDRLRAGQAATLPLRVRSGPGLVEYRIHLETAPELLIAGAGHISKILASLAVRLEFRVCVIDDRVEYANAERFPPPIRTIAADIAGALRTWPIGANTYVVIVTRGHKHDETALAAVLDSPGRYLGMIGSRRKIKVIFDDLRRQGAAPEKLNRVHAPIGLDISAVTTEEIALSIAAELVSVRRADRRQAVEGPFAVPDVPP